MITQSDGYHALIEHLTESFSLFEFIPQPQQGGVTVKLFIRYQLTEQICAIFSQKNHLQQQEKIYIIEEFDHIERDLHEVLGGLIQHPSSAEQQDFISEYAMLLKNLFDTQLEH